MPVKYMSISEFQKEVQAQIKEAVRECMLEDFRKLDEAVGGTVSSTPSIATVSTSTSTNSTGTQGTKSSTPGNDDPANNVMVPGTNLSINQGLQAAAKETNFKKKADLVQKMSDQIVGMKGVVVKEGIDGDAPAPEEWQVIHRALGKSIKAGMDEWNGVLQDLVQKGLKPAEAAKMIRSVQNVMDNMQQDVRLKKDVPGIKAKAAKAVAKSPLLKRFLPSILGGDLAV